MTELTPDHAQYLTDHAVDLDLARGLGVYSAAKPSDLPDEWRQGIGRQLPGIVFPWTAHDGRVSVQLRPDEPGLDADGEPVKYVFQADVAPVLWRVREAPDAERVLIVEGSKQCLVAAMYAPDGFEVFGIAGCWGWSHEGVPIRDLEVVEGRDAVVVFDADAAINFNVYSAGTRLAEALAAEGAMGVSWVRLPAGRKAGLDDVLANRSPERRADFLDRLVGSAKKKIADSKPKPKAGKDRPAKPKPADGRPVVVVDNDRLDVISELTNAMVGKWDGTELFNHGGVISKLNGAAMHPVDRGAFNNLIVQAVMPVVETPMGYAHTWPDGNTMQAVLASADKFTPLDRITRAPFIRPDGTMRTEAGYDEATRTLLAPSDDLDGIEVPENPTDDEVAAGRDLILDEWLGDMPFPDDASRANALALVLTPFIRGLVPLVPLAVVDGLQMGVGKNLLADCLSIMVLGEAADPKPYNADDAEHRKVLLSAFRAGDEMFVFDEAHTLEGANFARAITATTYSDRILGVSTMAQFPNRVTWISLGNQVQIRGDMTRRVYRIALHPAYANPMDRPTDTFRHPDLRSWTRENRSELFGAALTLARAWFVAGQPVPASGVSFGSFEVWQKTVGGILEVAEVPGFLGNLSEWRSESDFDSQYWTAHLMWLHETFGDVWFTTADVKTEAHKKLDEYESPPGLEDVSGRHYTRELGKAYGRLKGRSYEGYRVIKAGTGHNNTTKWTVCYEGHGFEDQGGGNGGNGGNQSLRTYGENTLSGDPRKTYASPAEKAGELTPVPPVPPISSGALVLDLETASAAELYSYGPGFVRLAGYANGGPVELTADADEVVRRIELAELVTGHNLMGFDLQALARYHRLDLQALVQRDAVFDTLLAARHMDPPMARSTGVDHERRYDLDRLGARLELGGKSGDLKALAKEFGGYDAIPVDDERYREYLTGDIELSARLGEHLRSEVGDDPYLAREHRVAAIAAQISLNGFRVDLDLLSERIAEGEARKAEALTKLAEKYGVPLVDGKGKPYAAPLATKAGKAALVEAFTGLGVTSFWTTGKTGDIATSYEAMHHLALQHHHVPEAVEIAKLVAQVVTVRTVYTTIQGNLVGDRVHPGVSFRQATGRWSLTNPGLTVMGKRGGRYHEREVFVPDPGEVIIAVDLSQVDMRAVAGLSGDRAYIEMLRSEDPHSKIAQALFGDAGRREEAKAIGHGWNYGRGIKAISNDNDLPPKVVSEFDRSMRERFPRLVEWQDEVRAVAQDGELLDNGFGRKMRPDPKRAHTQGPALMGQGAARDLMMDGLLVLPEEVLPMLRAQVHDEIVLSVPEADAEDVTRTVVDALTFEWKGVPIVADSSSPGSSWGAVYEKEK